MAYIPVSSNTKTREYGVEYNSLYSFEFEPAIWKEWYQKYGKGFGIFDFLQIAGQTVNLTRDSIRAFEDGSLVRAVRINSSGIAADTTTLTAGDPITFRLHADEYDSDGNTYLRVGDSIIIPPYYLSEDVPAEYRVTAVGASASADCTAYPLRSTAQITTAVPANEYLMVGATSYGRGMGQPAARSTGGYYRDFYTRIIKESIEITGGQIAQQSYRKMTKNGNDGLWNRALVEAEFFFNTQKDAALFLGDYNSNSLTGTDSHSANVPIKTTKGFWNHLEDLAQELNYTTSFAITDFDTAKDLFRSQGVVDTKIAFLAGPALITQLDNMGLSYMQTYGGGDALLDAMGKLGVSVKAFHKNGLDFILKELVSFSNAATYGAGATATTSLGAYFGAAGAMVPMTDVTITDRNGEFGQGVGAKISLPNLAIGYLNNNNEDRSSIFQVMAGVNGLGYPATSQYDKVEGFYLSEFALIAMKVNQMIRVAKSGSY